MYYPLSIPDPAPTPPPIPFLVDLHWFFWWVLAIAFLGVFAGVALHFIARSSERHSESHAGWYVAGVSGVVAVIALFFVMVLPASLPTP